MTDQATGLRNLADQARPRIDFSAAAAVVKQRSAARTIAITSGKGGVGKTNFTTNLALQLARSGERVIILDADLGLANVHVVMGVSPKYRLEHVLRGEKTLREILYPAATNIQILAGGSGIAELANLTDEERGRFVDGLADLDDIADIILIDTGAGLSHNVLGFVLAADEVVVISTPEPTSIADAYATIKVLSRENPDSCVQLLVNMSTSDMEGRAVAERLKVVCRQFLNVDLECIGILPHDAAVPKAVRAQQPFSVTAPDSHAARALSLVVQRLGYHQARNTGASGFLHRVARFFGNRQV
jgi:flagellar biosynthesis protein FlhG